MGVVSFTLRPLYPQGKSPWYPLDRRLGGPQSHFGCGGEDKNSQPPPGIEPTYPDRPALSQCYTARAITGLVKEWITYWYENNVFHFICIISLFLIWIKSRDSSVGIALGYGLDDRGSRVRFPAGAGNFSLHHRVQNGSGAHPTFYPTGTGASYHAAKRPGR
jgi:hypothetical protein